MIITASSGIKSTAGNNTHLPPTMSGAISALFGLKKTPDELISSSQKHLDVLEASENDSEEYIHVRLGCTPLCSRPMTNMTLTIASTSADSIFVGLSLSSSTLHTRDIVSDSRACLFRQSIEKLSKHLSVIKRNLLGDGDVEADEAVKNATVTEVCRP
jgi:hypothetical protein